ncbi:MAG: NFACT RNA binding domain-containing protein, partial [Acholeplasmatales bacterium]|nr:NFACT RNA binding domain-containing protein [Acholeplasmatales bacterium]
LPNLKDKKDKELVLNYYNNEYIEIPLDKKYTILENSNKYYKKYQKRKTAVSYTKEQIEITKNEIDYFNLLKYQIKDASINEAMDILDELINNKYIFNRKPSNKKKNQKPHLLSYIVDDCVISVGKNNIQNEYLTHKFSKPNDMWFHVKNSPGSHVVVHSTDLTENIIRTAANLAAYYSEFKDSSSVAVDYTLIKYIKKIPGKKLCFVTYTHQSTIYIDPDLEKINNLKVKK